MNERLKVSVIVPVYNSSDTLKRCIMSILNQTYPNIEIVLVNDGSLDNSIEICQYFTENYDSIVLLNKNHVGVSAARNSGIEMASGQYICFLDADDTYQNNAFSTAMRLAEEVQADIVMGGVQEKFDHKTRIETAKFVSNINYKIYDGNDLELLKRWTMERDPHMFRELPVSKKSNGNANMDGVRMGSVCAKFFKKSVFKNVRFKHNLALSEDLIFVYECFDKIKRMVIAQDVFYNYHRNNNSVTHLLYNPNSINDNLQLSSVLSLYEKDFDDKYKNFIDLKIIECFWQSVSVGIVANRQRGLLWKYFRLKQVLNMDIYRNAFKNVQVNYSGIKIFVLTIAGKLNFRILLLLISTFRYWRKK